MCSFVCEKCFKKSFSVFLTWMFFTKNVFTKCTKTSAHEICTLNSVHTMVFFKKKCLAKEILFFEIDYRIFLTICVGADNDKFLFFSLTEHLVIFLNN